MFSKISIRSISCMACSFVGIATFVLQVPTFANDGNNPAKPSVEVEHLLVQHISELSSKGMCDAVVSSDCIDFSPIAREEVLEGLRSFVYEMATEYGGMSQTDWVCSIHSFMESQYPDWKMIRSNAAIGGAMFVCLKNPVGLSAMPADDSTVGMACTDAAGCTTGTCTASGTTCTSAQCTRGNNCTVNVGCTGGDSCTAGTVCTSSVHCTSDDGECTNATECTLNGVCTSSTACTAQLSCSVVGHCTGGTNCTAGSGCSSRGGCTGGIICSGQGTCTTGAGCSDGPSCTAGKGGPICSDSGAGACFVPAGMSFNSGNARGQQFALVIASMLWGFVALVRRK